MPDELQRAPEVDEDLFQAYEWYEARRPGLGEEFLSSVTASFDRIARNPGLYAVVHNGVRRCLVRRFPYAVFYEIGSGAVVIYAVLHTAMNPGKWRQRAGHLQ